MFSTLFVPTAVVAIIQYYSSYILLIAVRATFSFLRVFSVSFLCLPYRHRFCTRSSVHARRLYGRAMICQRGWSCAATVASWSFLVRQTSRSESAFTAALVMMFVLVLVVVFVSLLEGLTLGCKA